MTKLLPTALAFALASSACLAPEDDPLVDGTQQALDQSPRPDMTLMPRGTKVVIPPEFRQPNAEQPPPPTAAELSIYAANTIIYMNRDGGTFTPGANDSRTNRSSIINQTSAVTPWSVDDASWQQVMSCVQAQFSAYDVEVTDVDPGNVPHYESVVAGSPGEIGMPNNVGGVSPFTNNCGIIDNSVVFTFANVLPQDPQIVCEIVAQEVAHSFGLDHEFLATDPMTYLQSDGPKSFQDVSAPCGEFEARGCRVAGQYDCGSDTQNSVELLTARLGLRQDDGGLPPALSILQPADGAIVAPGFEVVADASDDNGLTEVELLIDGESAGVLTEAPFSFTAPADLDLGTHVLEIIARDAGSETTDSIAITIDENASNDGDGDGNGDGNGDGSGGGDGPGSGRPNAGITGGCNATGGAGAGMAAWLLFALILVPRRRKRRS